MKNFVITFVAVVVTLIPLLMGIVGSAIIVREVGWMFLLGLFLILLLVGSMVERDILRKINKAIENAKKEKGGN